MVYRALVFLFSFSVNRLTVPRYVVFSGIYYAAGGTNHKGHRYIYKNLNYANGAKAASMVCLALVVSC